jgi:hypothetical protein
MFRVIWLDAALQDVTALLNLTPDHQAVFDAMDDVDRTLSLDPLSEGESRESLSSRIYFVPPIYVLYRADQLQRTVAISHVGLI